MPSTTMTAITMSRVESTTPYRLVLASTGFLLSGSAGALLAISTHLPARFGGIMHGKDVARDFVLLSGTALSPDLALLLGQLALTGCALRRGRTGTVGVVGLTLLGAAYTLGQLGEPITLRALSPATFRAPQAGIVLANLTCSTLMLVFGVRAWQRRRPTNQTAETEPAFHTR